MVCTRSWRGPEFQADGPQAPRGVVSGQSVLTPQEEVLEGQAWSVLPSIASLTAACCLPEFETLLYLTVVKPSLFLYFYTWCFSGIILIVHFQICEQLLIGIIFFFQCRRNGIDLETVKRDVMYYLWKLPLFTQRIEMSFTKKRLSLG